MDIEELRANIDAATHPAEAVDSDPTGVPHGIANRARVALLEARRARYIGEARAMVDDRDVVSATGPRRCSALIVSVRFAPAGLG